MGVRLRSFRVFKLVASIEELGDITADVVLKQELASRVVQHEVLHVEDHVIQQHQLFTISYSLFKVSETHSVLHNLVLEGHSLHNLVDNLTDQ